MIFDCPNCAAVNGVPEANLAATGTLLKCSACLQVFRVFPPDDEELVDTGEAPFPEATNIEPIPSHLRDDESTSSHVLSPEKGEQQTVELSNGAIIENILSQPIHENTGDGDSIEHVSATDEFVAAPANSNLSQTSDSSASIENGVLANLPSQPSPQGEKSMTSPGFEPLTRNSRGNGVKGHIVRLWNRSPLSLKAAVAVFPIAFLVGLSFGGSKTEGPLEVQNASARSAANSTEKKQVDILPLGATTSVAQSSITEASDVVSARSPTTSSRDGQKNAPQASSFVHPSDHSAPNGHAFVLPRKLLVKAKPKVKALVTGRFSGGDLVRIYDEIDEWSLVYMPGGGAVGFVRTKDLGARKTISALIEESKFENCSVRSHGNVAKCLDYAQAQETKCMDACGAVDDRSESSTRCRKICVGAYESCSRGCRFKRPTKRKRMRRRRR